MNKVGIFLVILAVNGVFGFWTPCGDEPAPHTITSSDCDHEICTVYRGSQLIAEAHMILNAVHHRLDVTFSTVFLGIPINLEIPPGHEDACLHLRDDQCPTVPGRNYIWMLNAPISTMYPAMSNVIVRGESLDKKIYNFKLLFFSFSRTSR